MPKHRIYELASQLHRVAPTLGVKRASEGDFLTDANVLKVLELLSDC